MELPRPDWDLWANVESAMCWELVLLTLDIDPDALSDPAFKDAIKARKDYQARCLAVERSGRFGVPTRRVDSHPLSFKCDLADFLKWTQSLRKPWSLPDELASWVNHNSNQAELSNLLETEIGELREKLAETEAELSLLKADALEGKTRSVAFMVIAALAKQYLKMPIHESRLTGIKEMIKDIECAGGSISESVLKKYIESGAEHLPRPEK